LSYTSSSIYMTLAQKYVVSELRAVKSLFLFYQNAAALLLYIPAALGWLQRFGISRSVDSYLFSLISSASAKAKIRKQTARTQMARSPTRKTSVNVEQLSADDCDEIT
jgi:hypothetical protein